MERTMVYGSNDRRGWPASINDHGSTTMGGPRNRVVVCHQAPRVGCDNIKGQLGGAPTIGSVP